MRTIHLVGHNPIYIISIAINASLNCDVKVALLITT